MKEKINILVIAFVIQMCLTIGLVYSGSDANDNASNKKLLTVDYDTVSKISIEQPEKSTLVLEKREGRWILPGYFDFPASKSKLDRIMGKLYDLSVGWPVATTKTAQKRFKVADEAFERKLQFMASDESQQTLLLGTSPGFKKIHARVSGETKVYAIAFSAYEASEKPVDWVDRGYLHLDRSDVAAIELPNLIVSKKDKQFSVEGMKDSEELVDQELQSLLSTVTSLSFDEVLGRKNKPEYQSETVELELALLDQSGNRTSYRFAKLKDTEDFVLKVSSHPYYFRVTKMSMDALQKIDRNKLIKSKAVENPDSEDKQSVDAESPPVKAADEFNNVQSLPVKQ